MKITLYQKIEFALLVFLLIASIVVLTIGSRQTNPTVTKAQDSWKCPGNQCNRCGEQGWWASGCDLFCATNPNGGPCQKIDGPLTPCGSFSKMCNYPSEDGRRACLDGRSWQCGNDACYHLVEPVVVCQTPTSIPSPALTAFPTSVLTVTPGGPTTNPASPTNPPQTNLTPGPNTQYPLLNPNSGSSILNGLLNLLIPFNSLPNLNPLNSAITPQLQPTAGTIPSPTLSPLSYGPPPNKPYYNPSIAVQCYTPNNFIRVYANNVNTPNSCYQETRSALESNLTRIDLLGTTVTVHNKVAPFFAAVNNDLAQYRVDGKRYRFAQGDYIFSSVGTYNFRCNVNASTSSDLCSQSCTLSPHAFGIAVDINPQTNANKSSIFDMPPEVVHSFEAHGFRWGGRFKDIFNANVDAMHFEYLEELCGA